MNKRIYFYIALFLELLICMSEEFKKQNIKEVDNSQSEYYKMISDVISVIVENQKR